MIDFKKCIVFYFILILLFLFLVLAFAQINLVRSSESSERCHFLKKINIAN